ncbi:MAG: class I SAM-dependent methyltransferase [Gammaproteobacteria bacterium]
MYPKQPAVTQPAYAYADQRKYRHMAEKTVEDVREFWESNPLFSGESVHETGSKEFFEDQLATVVKDVFAGKINDEIFPSSDTNQNVLDLGCGPGLWTVELARRGAQRITAADLTDKAIELTRKRASLYGIDVETSVQNAEQMTFEDNTFSHVNCQGVIHHTPDTEACVREISRVLQPQGTALVTVYYKNIFLRYWPLLKYLGKGLSKLGAGMKGRGREGIYAADGVDDVVRLYDGEDNPIGKAYSAREFEEMLAPHLTVGQTFLHFFPARTLPFPIPRFLHSLLNRRAGFMIGARCRKPPVNDDSL